MPHHLDQAKDFGDDAKYDAAGLTRSCASLLQRQGFSGTSLTAPPSLTKDSSSIGIHTTSYFA